MELRWIKKHSVCFVNPGKPGGSRFIRQEKILQVYVNGQWVEVPTVEDLEGYLKAKEAAEANKGPWQVEPGPKRAVETLDPFLDED